MHIYKCSILELVRTHFAAAGGEEVPPRIRRLADGKAAEPHRWQFQVFLWRHSIQNSQS